MVRAGVRVITESFGMVVSDDVNEFYLWHRHGVHSDRFESGTSGGSGAWVYLPHGRAVVENSQMVRRLAEGDWISIPHHCRVSMGPDALAVGYLRKRGIRWPFNLAEMVQRDEFQIPQTEGSPTVSQMTVSRGETWESVPTPVWTWSVVTGGRGTVRVDQEDPEAMHCQYNDRREFAMFKGCAILCKPGARFTLEIPDVADHFLEIVTITPKK